MTKADIIIIGGGAAGLMAAVGACMEMMHGDDRSTDRDGRNAEDPTRGGKRRDRKVLVLEKMPRPGRKIMLTGKGRCNFTNAKEWTEFSQHIHPKANFLKPAFYSLSPDALMKMFGDYGLKSVLERGDRVFPVSHRAMDVVDTLVYMARSSGAEIICGKEVCSIRHTAGCAETCEINQKKTEDKQQSDTQQHSDIGQFNIKCSDRSEYTCSRLIITTGGLSYPTSGSTGDGYGWAQEFGHKVKKCFPSLTAIVPKGYKIDLETAQQKTSAGTQSGSGVTGILPNSREDKDNTITGSTLKGHIDRSVPLSDLGRSLCGTSLKNVSISLNSNGNTIQEEFGDLDFTDGGIEGPIGFRISRNCVNAVINGSKTIVSIDLKPAVEQDVIARRIDGLWKDISEDRRSKRLSYKEKVNVLLGKVMPQAIIPAFVHFNPTVDHKILAERLKHWKMEITGYVGYERCVITAGGITTEEITAKTLESRLCKGLYFAGEIIDIDADTGGYNLHAAFSTGYLAGLSAAQSL